MLKDCRTRNYVNSKKDANNQGIQKVPGFRGGLSASEIKHTANEKTFYFQTELEGDHLTCNINQTICGKSKLLLDTGSELNSIKIYLLSKTRQSYTKILFIR